MGGKFYCVTRQYLDTHQWFKCVGDRVYKVPQTEAFENNFGGTTFPSMIFPDKTIEIPDSKKNCACTLVYIKKSCYPTMFSSVMESHKLVPPEMLKERAQAKNKLSRRVNRDDSEVNLKVSYPKQATKNFFFLKCNSF